ncbi:MAG: transposase [Cyanobacteria bacterium P01_D01_bin.156]
MARKLRDLRPNLCCHVTIRCNNREFRLTRYECRSVLLYALQKCREKYGFRLYALCIMSNHVHYLLKPQQPEELPKIMHWLNWYSAMCFNRMLNRTGHFWEKRYHSSGFEMSDTRRALNTIRYIHGNPKAANMQQGFFYDFSNYGTYERLTQDGITEWHLAFMALGATLEICATIYRKFCERYRPRPKPEKRNYWGNTLLARMKLKGKPKKKVSPGQKSLWQEWDAPMEEIQNITERFLMANAYNPDLARELAGYQVTN